MINLKQEIVNYPIIDIKSLMEREKCVGNEISDDILNSIILYNKALENIGTNNEDIAIMELKKAISMNSDFHEAINLLGICYVATKEYTKAAQLFQRVVSIEKNGIKALEYLNFLEHVDSPVQAQVVRKLRGNRVHINKEVTYLKSRLKTFFRKINSTEFIGGYLKSHMKQYAVGFVVCIMAVIVLWFALSVPYGHENSRGTVSDVMKSVYGHE